MKVLKLYLFFNLSNYFPPRYLNNSFFQLDDVWGLVLLKKRLICKHSFLKNASEQEVTAAKIHISKAK